MPARTVRHHVVPVVVLVQRNNAQRHRLALGRTRRVVLGQAGDDAHALGQLDHTDAEGDLTPVPGGAAVTAVQAHNLPWRDSSTGSGSAVAQ